MGEDEPGGLYEEVGVLAGTCEPTEGGEVIEVIGLIFPDSYGGESIRYLTLPGAKALLVDLRCGIEAAVKHRIEGDTDDGDD